MAPSLSATKVETRPGAREAGRLREKGAIVERRRGGSDETVHPRRGQREGLLPTARPTLEESEGEGGGRLGSSASAQLRSECLGVKGRGIRRRQRGTPKDRAGSLRVSGGKLNPKLIY